MLAFSYRNIPTSLCLYGSVVILTFFLCSISTCIKSELLHSLHLSVVLYGFQPAPWFNLILHFCTTAQYLFVLVKYLLVINLLITSTAK